MTWPGAPTYIPAINWANNITKLNASDMNTVQSDVANFALAAAQSAVDYLAPRVIEAGNLPSAYTIDFGSVTHSLVILTGTLTNASTTITLTNRVPGCTLIAYLTQDAIGGRNVLISDGTNTSVISTNTQANALSVLRVDCPDATDIFVSLLSGSGSAEQTFNKDAVNGYAGLDSAGKLKSAEFPSSAVTDPSGNGTVDWAVIKEAAPNPLMVEYAGGAKGDGVTDDTAALQAFLNAGLSYGKISNPPGGAYRVSSGLTLPASMSLDIDHFALIRATSAMAAILTTANNTGMNDKFLRGGIFDCNQQANTGILVPWVTHRYELTDNTVYSPLQHAMIVGDSSLNGGVPSDGAIVRNFNTSRPSAQTTPAGYYGLWLRFVSDCQIHGSFIQGMDTGTRNDQGNNKFLGVHVWGYNGLTTGFDDNSDGQYYDCCVDDPSLYGFHMRQHRAVIFGGRTYISKTALDNIVNAIQLEQAAQVLTVTGHKFIGASGSARLAKDIGLGGSATSTAVVILGSQRLNVVGGLGFDQLPSSVNGFNIAAGQNKIGFPTSFSGSMGLANGTNLQGYKGNFATPTTNIDPSTGAIQPGNSTGLGARQFSGSGAPVTPGGAITYIVGDLYWRLDGGVGTTLYRCTTGGTSPVWLAILDGVVFRLDAYGADPTGATLSDAAWTACYAAASASVQGSGANSAGAMIELGGGIYKFSINTVKISDYRIGLRGQGRQITQIESSGSTGDIVYITDTSVSGSVAAPCYGFTVYGFNAGANVNGFHYGDRAGASLIDIQVWGCQASGSRNYLFRNDNASTAGCEGTFARLESHNGGAANVTFDGNNANGTFDYGDWGFHGVGSGSGAGQNHHWIEFVNQAHMVGGKLRVTGNLNAPATFTSTLLAIGNSVSDKARIVNSNLHFTVEADGGGGTTTDIVIQADGSFTGGIVQCSGQFLTINGSGTFTAGSVTGSAVVNLAGRLSAPFFTASGVLAQLGQTFAMYERSGSNFKSMIGANGHIGFLPVVAPGIAAAAGAGTTPPTAALSGNSSDTVGQAQWGTGTTPSAGAQVAVTFGSAFGNSPIVILIPANDATAALQPYVTSPGTGGFSVATHLAPTASQSAGTYRVNYLVVGQST